MSLKLCQSPSISGTLVLPQITAPASRYRVTVTASVSATLSAHAGFPHVDGVPAQSKASLMVMGTPCRGPQHSPAASAASASAARWRASSILVTITAFTAGLNRS